MNGADKWTTYWQSIAVYGVLAQYHCYKSFIRFDLNIEEQPEMNLLSTVDMSNRCSSDKQEYIYFLTDIVADRMSVKLMSTSADDVMTIIYNITFCSITHCPHCNTQDMFRLQRKKWQDRQETDEERNIYRNQHSVAENCFSCSLFWSCLTNWIIVCSLTIFRDGYNSNILL